MATKRINPRRKILIVFFAVALILFSLIFLFKSSFTNLFAIFPTEEKVEMPSVSEGQEVVYLGYKYSNNSNVIVKTKKEVSCKWKPDSIDDGWKECETIFEIENLGQEKPKITNPDIQFDFEKQNIRNLHLSYSTSFDVVEEKVLEVGSTAVDSPDAEQGPAGGITGGAIYEPESNSVEENPAKFKEVTIKKREFYDFSPMVAKIEFPSNSTEENITTENETFIEENVSNAEIALGNDSFENFSETETESVGENKSENSQALEPDVSENESLAEESLNPTSSEAVSEEPPTPENPMQDETIPPEDYEKKGSGSFLTPLIIKPTENEENALFVKTSKPFAIKVNFEIPKYASNQFDFKLIQDRFKAAIDPDVSPCSDLDTPGTYTLNQDISSEETCFTVSEDNIVLDCQGHAINHSTSGGGGSAVFVSSDNAVIKNCVIFSSAHGMPEELAVSLYAVNNITIQASNITVTGISAYGIYAQTSSNLNLVNNTINNSGTYGAGVYFESSQENFVYGNFVSIEGFESPAIYLNEVHDSVIENNFLFIYGNSSYGIYLYSDSLNNLASKNDISVLGNNSYGIYLSGDCSNNILNGNFVQTSGERSSTIQVLSDRNNLTANELVTFGYQSYGIFLGDEASDNFVDGSSVLTSGIEGHGVYVGNNCRNFVINGANLKTLNSSAHSIYVAGNSNFSVFDSVLNSSFNNTSDFNMGSLAGGGVWNFTNVSFSDKAWSDGVNATLNVGWYLDVLTNYADGSSAANVNVTARDVNGTPRFSELSKVDGEISTKVLLEYIQSGSNNLIYHSNYSLNASLPDRSENLFKSINLTGNKAVNFVFTRSSKSNIGAGGTSGTGSTETENSSGTVVQCKPSWTCSKWSDCVGGNQTRICVNANLSCNVDKPEEKRSCNEKRKTLFDITLELPKKEISPSENLVGSIGLINLGLPGKINVSLVYQIKDSTNQTVYTETEVALVETQTEFIKTFKNLKLTEGPYTLIVNLMYEGQLEPATAEAQFNVIKSEESPTSNTLIYVEISVVVVLVGFFVIWLIFRKRSKVDKNSSFKSEDSAKNGGVIN
jgi:hypothetical protein